jgi:hypothetical protein
VYQVDADEVLHFAEGIYDITNQETGELSPIAFTDGQREVLEALAEHRRTIVLKGRQQYVSTACCAYAMVFAQFNPGVKVAIVADLADKAEGLLAKCAAWANANGIPTRAPSHTKILTLWNGAEIHALTANVKDVKSDEAKAGRSFSYGLIILSEFAFYTRDAPLLASLTRSALAGAHIIIESTATPAENAFRKLWEHGPGWHHVFLGIEEHEAYQLDENVIDDATWKHLEREYKFESRPHAAYWWRMVQTDMAGDIHRGLREAPILPEHAFAFAEGRWIFRYTERKPAREELGLFTFADSIPGGWRYYDEPDDSGVCIGIDTGGGVGADASAIAVVGWRHGNLIATWVSRNLVMPGFIDEAKRAARRFPTWGTHVEGNGMGKGVYQALSLIPDARTAEHWSEEAEKPIRMNLVKLAIESGQIVAGPELVFEAKHSEMLRPKRGRGSPLWEGPDDLLNALGFALVWRRDNPFREQRKPVNPRTHVDRSHVRSKGRKAR